MRRYFTGILFLTLFLTAVLAREARAENTTTSSDGSNSALPLCLPGAYPNPPVDCLAMGPSQSLSDLAKIGYTMPPQTPPGVHPPADLADIPYQYIKVTADKATIPLYTSPPKLRDDPAPLYQGPGFKYFSYLNKVENDAGLFYYTRGGYFVDGEYVARAAVPFFQGVQINGPVKIPFGWVLTTIDSQVTPGSNQPFSGKKYNRFDRINVYECQKASGEDWCMIGLNEWVPARTIAQITSEATPPAGVTNGRWVDVNLAEETVSVYDNNQLVFATLASTGLDPFFTQPGLFQIYEKKVSETMSGSFAADKSDYYYLEDVPWTMYFDKARALHGAYWHSIFGYPRSHGCVNLSIADAHWIYNWANVGDFVWVHDPTGKTPTDPAYYSKGGA
jgi:hypothetical protein